MLFSLQNKLIVQIFQHILVFTQQFGLLSLADDQLLFTLPLFVNYFLSLLLLPPSPPSPPPSPPSPLHDEYRSISDAICAQNNADEIGSKSASRFIVLGLGFIHQTLICSNNLQLVRVLNDWFLIARNIS